MPEGPVRDERLSKRTEMTEKIEDTIKLLVDEGKQKGFLTYAEMNKLLEDQFLPPDQMDQVFVALEDAGVDVLEGTDADEISVTEEKEDAGKKAPVMEQAAAPERERPEITRALVPERIDDPVRMYLGDLPAHP